MIKKENKEITKKVSSKLTNPDSKNRKYEADFHVVRMNAIISTGGIAALLSGDSEIEFSGFREVSS